jgi:YD repeat-containing protein
VTAVDDAVYIAAIATGSTSNYPYSLQTLSYDSALFSQPSFLYPAISGQLDGGANAQSTGTGTVYSYCVGQLCPTPNNGYDHASNLLGYTDTVMGTWSFSYDTLNRLAGAADTAPVPPPANLQPVNPNTSYCWAYDAFGNRLQQAGSNAAFQSNSGGANPCQPQSSASYSNTCAQYNGTVNGTGNNQISASSQNVNQAKGYDASGDVTYDGQNQYLYDAEGRICAVASTVRGTTTMTGYLYDAEGTRVAKGSIQSMTSCDPTLNGFKTINDYVLGLGGEQVTEMGIDTTAGSGTITLAWQHTNVWAGGKLLGTDDKVGLHFYLDDPLGTRRAKPTTPAS